MSIDKEKQAQEIFDVVMGCILVTLVKSYLFLKRLFCRHKEIEYKRKIEPFHNLQGETIYKFCKKCGKMIGTEFLTNEEMLIRFK